VGYGWVAGAGQDTGRRGRLTRAAEETASRGVFPGTPSLDGHLQAAGQAPLPELSLPHTAQVDNQGEIDYCQDSKENCIGAHVPIAP